MLLLLVRGLNYSKPAVLATPSQSPIISMWLNLIVFDFLATPFVPLFQQRRLNHRKPVVLVKPFLLTFFTMWLNPYVFLFLATPILDDTSLHVTKSLGFCRLSHNPIFPTSEAMAKLRNSSIFSHTSRECIFFRMTKSHGFCRLSHNPIFPISAGMAK